LVYIVSALVSITAAIVHRGLYRIRPSPDGKHSTGITILRIAGFQYRKWASSA
jgi:hypothetical protein